MPDPYKDVYNGNEDNIYNEESVEEMLDEKDAISPEEEAFMRGYNKATKKRKKKKSKSLKRKPR